MTYAAFDHPAWPFVFIIIAGVLPTAIWRWAGVVLVGNLSETSETMVLVRCIATALVAAVVAQFVFSPAGALADVPL
ncbi:MAG: AzlD domain-containing protein, partial [Pseudomonadota bacterium]